MAMKHCITLVAVLLAGNMYGADGIEVLQKETPLDTIIATPTNLTISIRGGYFLERYPKLPDRITLYPGFLVPHEELVLIPDQEVRLGERHGNLVFTPVAFKDKQIGFRIVGVFDACSFGRGVETNALVYVALGDALTEMGAEDVEMIMVKGEWVKDENPLPVIIPKEEPAERSNCV
jgi:hypothetical protein